MAERHRGIPLPLLLALILGLALLAYVAVELLQRHRYASLGRRLEAAVLNIQNRAILAADSKGARLAGPAWPSTTRFTVTASGDSTWSSMGRLWRLEAVIDHVDARNSTSVSLMIYLTLDRKLFLRDPAITVRWSGKIQPSLVSLVDHWMSEFRYDTVWAE